MYGILIVSHVGSILLTSEPRGQIGWFLMLKRVTGGKFTPFGESAPVVNKTGLFKQYEKTFRLP